MTQTDDWGRDPLVRAMRRLFAQMESEHKEMLQRLGMSPYDLRLRFCREGARVLFEQMLSPSTGGQGRNEDEAAALYLHCFIQVLRQQGLPVPDEAPWKDDGLQGGLN